MANQLFQRAKIVSVYIVRSDIVNLHIVEGGGSG